MADALSTLNWPALWISTLGFEILRYDTEERFCTVKYSAAASGWQDFADIYLVDSIGRKIVLGERRLKTPFTSLLKRAIAKITNPWVRIVHPCSYCSGMVSVDELRAMIFRNWAADPDFWADYPLDELRPKAEAAKTIGELIRLF